MVYGTFIYMPICLVKYHRDTQQSLCIFLVYVFHYYLHKGVILLAKISHTFFENDRDHLYEIISKSMNHCK